LGYSELQPGAANAVRVCLNIQPHERVTVISDIACREIGDALIREIQAVGASYAAFVLEDEAPRPLAGLPDRIAEDMEHSDVSIFAARVQANELGSRMAMTDIVNRRRMRHAHMVNITPRIMTEGMRADFRIVDRISQKVIDTVRSARVIRASTAAGTDLTAELNPNFAVWMPVGRTYDIKTGKDWEGAGVAPDVAVDPKQALVVALEKAGLSHAEAVKLDATEVPAEPVHSENLRAR